MEDSQVAAALSAELTRRIGPQRFELWFKTQSQQFVVGNCLTIRAASGFVLEWLKKNLADDVRASWEAVAGQDAAADGECAVVLDSTTLDGGGVAG